MSRRTHSGDWVLALMLAGAVVMAGVGGFFLKMPEPEVVQPARISVEEARFMLECTQDWGLTGDECRAVLHGENPPEYDGYGC